MSTHPRQLRAAIVVAVTCVLAFTPLLPAGSTPSPRQSEDSPLREMLLDIDPDRIENSVQILAGFGTRNTLSQQNAPHRGVGAARDWIADQFRQAAAASEGRMTVTLQRFTQPVGPRVPRPTPITNVVATLRGVQPASADRTYVVSAHYDSICGNPTDARCDAPGADDDASGVAAVLEMARVMASRQFDATIIFLAVAGEEQGLLGSDFFARAARASGMDIAAMLNNDIIGSPVSEDGERHPDVVRMFAEGVPTTETDDEAATRRSVGGENDSPSRQLARFVHEVTEADVPGMRVDMIYRRDRFLRGGDHISFLRQGYPAVRFTEPNENFAHQHKNVRIDDGVVLGDLAAFVDPEYVARVTQVNAAALARMANAPAAPSGATVVVRGLSNDTHLRWEPAVEPDLAGYEIVWRDTIEPFWTHSIAVGKVTEFTVDLSKDNFFFGVRAVDTDGNRSPVSFPVPGR